MLEVRHELTKRDILRASWYRILHNPISVAILIGLPLVAGAMVVAPALNFFNEHAFNLFLLISLFALPAVFVVIPFFLLLAGVVHCALYVRFSAGGIAGFLGPAEMRLDEAGIEIRNRVSEGRVKWSRYVKARLTRNYLYVVFPNRGIQPIRRTAENGALLEEMKRYIDARAAGA